MISSLDGGSLGHSFTGLMADRIIVDDVKWYEDYILQNANLTQNQDGKDTALQFTGGTTSLAYQNPYNFPNNKELQVSFKIKTSVGDSRASISYAVSNSNNNTFLLYSQSSLSVYINNASRNTGINLADDIWHKVIVQWRSSDGALRVYVDDDDIPRHSSTGFKTGDSIPQGGALVLGQEQDKVLGRYSSSQAFIGLLDGVKILGEWSI